MKRSILITPLNCGYATGLNNILRMEPSEYAADSTRSIYCKSPDLSWFKMKSVSTTPYLEPAIYGIKPGDIVTVEYDALLESGNADTSYINNSILSIKSSYTTSGISLNGLPNNSLTQHYKHFVIPFHIPYNFADIGIVANIRPLVTNNVVIIKNVEITISTSNQSFNPTDNIMEYRTKTDFLKCIDFLSGTNVYATYNGLKTVYDASEITFPDDNTISFAGVDTTNFKGLMTMFGGYAYRPSIAVYAEHIADGSKNIAVTARSVAEDGTVAQVGTVNMAATTTAKKQIIYFNGGTTACRKTLVEIGQTGVTGFSLKNVRISMPQFDDAVKRSPNQLDELYTALAAKLR